MDCVKTKSSELFVAPLLVQVAELTLLVDGPGISSPTYADAKQVKECVKNVLIEVEKFKKQLKDVRASRHKAAAKESERIADDRLQIAATELASEVSSMLDDQPVQGNARQHIGLRCKAVAEAAVKVLLLGERACSDDIVTGLELVKASLMTALSVQDADALVTAFKQYTVLLVDVLVKASRWQNELSNDSAAVATELALAIADMRRSSASLSSALQTRVACPGSEAAEENLSYMASHILLKMDKIASIVQKKLGEERLAGSWKGPGYFVGQMDRILDHLASGEATPDSMRQYEVLLESVVRHATGVASACSRWTSRAHGAHIFRSCVSVLTLSRALKRLVQLAMTAPYYNEIRMELDDRCTELTSELHDLERHVNAALLEGVVNVFKETSEPLDRLVRAALSHSPSQQAQVDNKHTMETYIREFLHHAESIYLLAGFVADSSTEDERVRALKCSVANLKKIDPEILPALASCCELGVTPMAVEKLRCLHRHWSRELQCLVTMIDEVTDPMMFVDISESQLTTILQELVTWQTWLQDGHAYSRFIGTTRATIGHAKRAAAAVKQAISCSRDPLLRRILHAELNELKLAITKAGTVCQKLSSLNQWSRLALGEGQTAERRAAMEDFIGSGKSILDCLKLLKSCLSSGNPEELLKAIAKRNAQPSNGIAGQGEVGDAVAPATRSGSGISDAGAPELSTIAQLQAPTTLGCGSSAAKSMAAESMALRPSTGSLVQPSLLCNSSSNGSCHELARQLEQYASTAVHLAIACDWPAVDTIWTNDLLPELQNIIEVSEKLCTASSIRHADRDNLLRTCSSLVELTPDLLAALEVTAKLRSNNVGALRETAHCWCSMVIEVGTLCDALLVPNIVVSNKLVESATHKDQKNFQHSAELFRGHCKAFEAILDAAAGMLREAQHQFVADVSSSGGAAVATATTSLEQAEAAAEELSRVGQQLLQASQQLLDTAATAEYDGVNGLPVAEKRRAAAIALSARWAASSLLLESDMKQLCDSVCTVVPGCENWDAAPSAIDSYAKAQQALTDTLDIVCSRYCSIDAQTTARILVSEAGRLATSLLSSAADGSSGDCSTAPMVPDGCAVGRTLRTALLCCRWRLKVTALYESVIDPALSKLCRPLYMLAVATMAGDRAGATSRTFTAAAPEPRSAGTSVIEPLLQKLVNGVKGICTSMSAMTSSADDQESTAALQSWHPVARQSAEVLLAIVSTGLPKVLQQLKGDHSIRTVSCFKNLQRCWAFNIARLTSALQQAEAHGRSIREFTLHWFHDIGIQPETSQVSHARSTPGTRFLSEASRDSLTPFGVRKPSDLNKEHATTRLSSAVDDGRIFSLQRGANKAAAGTHVSAPVMPAGTAEPRALNDVWVVPGFLEVEDSTWKDGSSPVVHGIKEVAELLHNMIAFGQPGSGAIKNIRQLCRVARSAAVKSSTIYEFAQNIGRRAKQQRSAQELQKSAERIQTLAAQMRVLSFAGQDTVDDVMTRKMLLRNATNLKQAIVDTMLSIEAVSIEGLGKQDEGLPEGSPVIDVVRGWRRHLRTARRIDASTCKLNDLGLRILNGAHQGPQLADLISCVGTK